MLTKALIIILLSLIQLAHGSEELKELLPIIENPANTLNESILVCHEDPKEGCSSYLSSLDTLERKKLKNALECFSPKNPTSCSLIWTWLRRDLADYKHLDPGKYKSRILEMISVIEKHQGELSKCDQSFSQIQENLCFIKPNLDFMKIKKKKLRVTPDGLFNDYTQEHDWLVISTPDRDLELSNSIIELNKGIKYFHISRIKKTVIPPTPGLSSLPGSTQRIIHESDLDSPIGLLSLGRKAFSLEAPKLSLSSFEYEGRTIGDADLAIDNKEITIESLKPNLNQCEILGNMGPLLAQARIQLAKEDWNPWDKEKYADEAITAAADAGVTTGVYNLQDAGENVVEGVESFGKLIRNAETPDPEGKNQCIEEENKKAAAAFGNTCSKMLTILKRTLGNQVDTIFGTCYRQHCKNDVSSASGIAQCVASGQVNPVFQANMAGCISYMMKQEYGDAVVTAVKNCTLLNGGDAFSKCMAGISVNALAAVATAGTAQGLTAAAATSQGAIQLAVNAGRISASSGKWLSRAANATKAAGIFTTDMFLNPLPTDPADLLRTRKGLFELLKDKSIPLDVAQATESRIKEIDATLKKEPPPLPVERKIASDISGAPIEQSQAVKSIQNKPSDIYVKPPIVGYEIKAGDTLETLPADIRKHLGKVDGTNYDADYFKQNAGSVIALQYKSDGTPDFYIIGKKTYEEKYVPSSMKDFATQSPDQHKGFITLESAKDSDRIRVIKKPGETTMVKMSEAGYPIDKEITIHSPWGDTQTKPAGQDGYLVIDGDKTYIVNADASGSPLGYAKAGQSQIRSKSISIRGPPKEESFGLIEQEKLKKFHDGVSEEDFEKLIRGQGITNDHLAVVIESSGVSYKVKVLEGVNGPCFVKIENCLKLLTSQQLERLPNGTIIEGADGKKYIIGIDEIKMDSNNGWSMYGIKEEDLLEGKGLLPKINEDQQELFKDLKTITQEIKMTGTNVPRHLLQKEEDLRKILTSKESNIKFKTEDDKKRFFVAAEKMRQTEIDLKIKSKEDAISKNLDQNKALGRSPARVDSNGIPIFSPGRSYFRAMVIGPDQGQMAKTILNTDGWKSGNSRGIKIADEHLGDWRNYGGATRFSETAKFEDQVSEFVGADIQKSKLNIKTAEGYEKGVVFPRDSRVVGVGSSTAVIDVAKHTANKPPKGSYIMLTEIVVKNKKIINSDQLMRGRNLTTKFPTQYSDGGVEFAVTDIDPDEIVNVIFIPID